MTTQTTICVNRNNLAALTPIITDLGPLKDEHIRVRITSFALTANNVTYMVTGDMIGYWKYFDPQAYGLTHDDKNIDALGRMPVWGFAEITESRIDGLAVGTKIYGFFPVTDYFDMKPLKLNSMGFSDGADHRLELHSIYNHYILTASDPSFSEGLDDLQPVLRPLFTTSFLIDDFLAQDRFFGAEQVLLLSASSKTALGTAFCLKTRGGIKLAGLTSSRNIDFVKSTGFYDTVENYDSLTNLNPNVKTAIVDMAGNGEVSMRLYNHFEDNILYNCMVGKSHWEGGQPPKVTKGAPPVMFFAPDCAKKRLKEWGPAGFAQNLGALWLPFCDSAQNWLNIEKIEGVDSFAPRYQSLLSGNMRADIGQLMRI